MGTTLVDIEVDTDAEVSAPTATAGVTSSSASLESSKIIPEKTQEPLGFVKPVVVEEPVAVPVSFNTRPRDGGISEKVCFVAVLYFYTRND